MPGQNFRTEIGDIEREEGRSCVVSWKIDDFYSISFKKNNKWESPEFQFFGFRWHLNLNQCVITPAPTISEFMTVSLFRDQDQVPIYNIFCIFGIIQKDGCIYKPFHFEGDWILHRTLGPYRLYKPDIEDKFIFDVEGPLTISCVLHAASKCKIDAYSQTLSFNGLRELRQESQELCQNKEKIQEQDEKVCKERSEFKERYGSHEPQDIFRSNVIDKYCEALQNNLKQLKIKCIDFMKRDICMDTFYDVFSLAIKHSDGQLMQCSKAFFVTNAKQIVETTTWVSFLKEHPIESNILVIAAIDKLSK